MRARARRPDPHPSPSFYPCPVAPARRFALLSPRPSSERSLFLIAPPQSHLRVAAIHTRAHTRARPFSNFCHEPNVPFGTSTHV